MKKTKDKNKSKADILDALMEPFFIILELILSKLIDLSIMLVEKIVEYIKVNVFKVYSLKPINKKHIKSKQRCDYTGAIGRSLNNSKDITFDELNTAKHTAVMGSTGTGKSVCLSMLTDKALAEGRSLVLFDPKPSPGSLNLLRETCIRRNKKLYVFSDVGIDYSCYFNPLADGDVHEIVDRIMDSCEWSEQFYKNQCRPILEKIMTELKESSEVISFYNIFLRLSELPVKEQRNIEGLTSQIKSVLSQSIIQYTHQEDIEMVSFERIRQEEAVLYIGVPVNGISGGGTILNKCFFGQLLTHMNKAIAGSVQGMENPEEKPMTIIFDELASTIHSGFVDLQNKCRAASMEIIYATQCASDIDQISPNLTKRVFENTHNFFIFNQTLPEHTEMLSRMIGTTHSVKQTYQRDESGRTGEGSERDVEEFIVHSNIFRELRIGQCIFMQRTPKRVELINLSHYRSELDPKYITHQMGEVPQYHKQEQQ